MVLRHHIRLALTADGVARHREVAKRALGSVTLAQIGSKWVKPATFEAGAAQELFGLATLALGRGMVLRHHIRLALTADGAARRCERQCDP